MEGIGGFSDLAAKVFNQCGLLSTFMLAAIVWLMTQLANVRKTGEADRAAALKLLNEQIDANQEIAVKLAKADVMLTSLMARNHGGDN